MRLRKNHILILFILSVVAIAGCVGQRQTTVAPNDGLVITEFSDDNDKVDEGENVAFTLGVENQGGTDASNVIAELVGIEQTWRDIDGELLLDTQSKDLKNMLRPDPQFNIPGDLKTAIWRLKTPSLPQLTQPFTVKAKVTYDYNTTGAITIKAASKTFIRAKYAGDSTQIQNPMTITNTNAPVKISLTDKIPPIIFDDTDTGDNEQDFVVQFILKNVGSGFPITDSVPGKVLGNIKLLGPFEFRDCLGAQNTNEVELNEDNVDFAKLKISSGEVKISCVVTISKDTWGARQEETATILFDLVYRYWIDKEVIVTVFGK